MRLRLAAIIAGMCAAGPAAASSFVVMPAAEPGPSPSIVFLGEPAASTAPEPAGEPLQPAAELAGTAEALEQDRRPDARPVDQLPYHISPSIVSYGEPAVEDMKVSSIDDEPQDARRGLPPMVIRGGIVGDAFADSAPAPLGPNEEPAQASASADRPAETPQPEAPERQAAAPPPASSRPPTPGLDVPR